MNRDYSIGRHHRGALTLRKSNIAGGIGAATGNRTTFGKGNARLIEMTDKIHKYQEIMK